MMHRLRTRTSTPAATATLVAPRAFGEQRQPVPSAGHDLARIAVSAAGGASTGPTAGGVVQRALASVSSGVIQRSDERPTFTTDSKKGSVLHHNDQPDRKFPIDAKKPDLPSHNAAQPHRMSWKDIRDNTAKFHDKTEKEADFRRWTDRFVAAGNDRLATIKANVAASESANETTRLALRKELLKRAKASQDDFVSARDKYAKSGSDADKEEFLKHANSFHANVPDLGPHNGVNNPVREAGHLHFVKRKPASSSASTTASTSTAPATNSNNNNATPTTATTTTSPSTPATTTATSAPPPPTAVTTTSTSSAPTTASAPVTTSSAPATTATTTSSSSTTATTPATDPSRGRKRTRTQDMRDRTPSPMSRRVLEMSPERLSVGLAFEDDDNLITTTGETMPLDQMSPATQALVKRHQKKIISSFDPDAPFGATAVSATASAPKQPKVKKPKAAKSTSAPKNTKTAPKKKKAPTKKTSSSSASAKQSTKTSSGSASAKQGTTTSSGSANTKKRKRKKNTS